jgi:hypothetical protein
MNDPKNDQMSGPADATATALVTRVKRLMVVTMAATFLALALVLMVIGYRLLSAGGSAPAISEAVLPLPAGAKVVSASVSDGHIAVTVDIGGSAEILSFDQKTLKPLGRIRLAPAR